MSTRTSSMENQIPCTDMPGVPSCLGLLFCIQQLQSGICPVCQFHGQDQCRHWPIRSVAMGRPCQHLDAVCFVSSRWPSLGHLWAPLVLHCDQFLCRSWVHYRRHSKPHRRHHWREYLEWSGGRPTDSIWNGHRRVYVQSPCLGMWFPSLKISCSLTPCLVVPKKHRGFWVSSIFMSSLPFLGFGPAVAQALGDNTAAGWRWCFYLGIIVAGKLDLALSPAFSLSPGLRADPR